MVIPMLFFFGTLIALSAILMVRVKKIRRGEVTEIHYPDVHIEVLKESITVYGKRGLRSVLAFILTYWIKTSSSFRKQLQRLLRKIDQSLHQEDLTEKRRTLLDKIKRH